MKHWTSSSFWGRNCAFFFFAANHMERASGLLKSHHEKEGSGVKTIWLHFVAPKKYLTLKISMCKSHDRK